MDRESMQEIVEDLIEQAKQISKEKFLNFSENVYGIDKETWEHLWKVPIVSPTEYDNIFPVELSSMSRDDVEYILDDCIEDELGDSEAVFITYENIIASISEKSEEAAQEYENGIKDGNIKEDYNAVIVYDIFALEDMFEELWNAGMESDPPKTLDEIKSTFLKLVSGTFLHERMHLNANTLLNDLQNPDFEPLVNGIQSGFKNGETDYNADRENDNEVVIDTVAKIIQEYSNGDTIDECLYKVIENRGGTSSYKNFDDRLALSLFTLFPNEFCEWVMLEAYDEHHTNIYEEKYLEVLGENRVFRNDEMFKKVGEYFNKNANINMTPEQIIMRKKMLEMLGVKNINLQQTKIIDSAQIKDLSTSEQAMELLSESAKEMNAVYNELQNPTKNEIDDKIN